jgi:cytidylate kinase
MFQNITISREYGSGGAEIARRVAERLGWKLIDKCLIEDIARLAKVTPEVARRYDERVNPWFERLIKAVWRGGFEGSASRVEAGAFDAEEMAQLAVRVIREAAELGHAVIVGRGGQCILRDRQDTFHVSVHAPLELRVENLRRMFGSAAGTAEQAEETDRQRAAYVRRYFGEDWKEPRLYHLVIDASMGLDRAADAIVEAAGLGPAGC